MLDPATSAHGLQAMHVLQAMYVRLESGLGVARHTAVGDSYVEFVSQVAISTTVAGSSAGDRGRVVLTADA